MIETPFVATDGIIQLYDDNNVFLGIVLIKRKNPPYGWALPGGFVDIGEKVEDALVREMREETSLDVEIEGMVGVYSDPSRDARFHTVSVVYRCQAHGTPKAADDAKEVKVVPLEEVSQIPLAFDHAKIIEDFMEQVFEPEE